MHVDKTIKIGIHVYIVCHKTVRLFEYSDGPGRKEVETQKNITEGRTQVSAVMRNSGKRTDGQGLQRRSSSRQSIDKLFVGLHINIFTNTLILKYNGIISLRIKTMFLI